MQEVITASGAVIRHDATTPEGLAAVSDAVRLLGGEVIAVPYDEKRETVLRIIDQGVVGTTMTDLSGAIYELRSEGWVKVENRVDTAVVKTPPHQYIVSATMPGGWSWHR